MFQFLMAIVLAAAAGWIVQAVAGGVLDRAISGFRELIGGWRADGWPRGVQEEDRDRPWGQDARPSIPTVIQGLVESTAQAVTTAQVRGHTRSR